MKLYKTLLFVLTTIVLAACGSNFGVTFTVVNKSGSVIDSLLIEPNINRQYKSIAKDRQITYITNMHGTPKTDGSYGLYYQTGDGKKYYNFGYYTNGAPLDYYTTITLLPDTILIDRVY